MSSYASFRIDPSAISDLAMELIRIPSYHSVDGRETQLQRFIADWGISNGLDVIVRDLDEGVPLVLIGIKGSGKGKSVVFNGHTDTVPIDNMVDGLVPRIENNWLYGRGSADMKGPLASMMMAVKALNDSGFRPRGDVYFAAVPGEERGGGQIGSRYLAEHFSDRFDFCVIGEPTQEHIGTSHRGMYIGRLEIELPKEIAPHPGFATDVHNVMYPYVRFVLEAQKRISGYIQPDNVTNSTDGGKLLPYRVSADFLRKTEPGQSFEGDEEVIQGILSGLKREYAGMQMSFSPAHDEMLPMSPPDDPALEIAVTDAFSHVYASAPSVGQIGFGCDGWIVRVAGIDTVVFGPIGEGMHGPEERVSLKSLHKTALVYADTAHQLSK